MAAGEALIVIGRWLESSLQIPLGYRKICQSLLYVHDEIAALLYLVSPYI